MGVDGIQSWHSQGAMTDFHIVIIQQTEARWLSWKTIGFWESVASKTHLIVSILNNFTLEHNLKRNRTSFSGTFNLIAPRSKSFCLDKDPFFVRIKPSFFAFLASHWQVNNAMAGFLANFSAAFLYKESLSELERSISSIDIKFCQKLFNFFCSTFSFPFFICILNSRIKSPHYVWPKHMHKRQFLNCQCALEQLD